MMEPSKSGRVGLVDHCSGYSRLDVRRFEKYHLTR